MNANTPQPQWLDAQEQDVWREYLRATRLLEAALDHDLQAHGLQLSEYEILSMLSEQPDRRLRMSVIAELVVQSRSRLTHTAGRLENRGWVRREACEGDRRGVELVLTDTGFAEITRMAPTHVSSVRRNLLDHLSREDLLALGRAMAAISNGILGTGVCDDVRASEEQHA
ncbi:MAG TPA: MarR family transcriptional regulator [Dermatophilaceae bacterium]|jgi:DNA-binding MarR family transcriptional regulator|nr:MarR family transcriptional regulator [Dermatophilaceae bacterium]